MTLEGKTFRANLLLEDKVVTHPDGPQRFTVLLERCLVDLCRQLDIPIPIWMEKNTHEFARFHQTIFFAEQFTEPIKFERFQIRWLE